jgi:hypothetical protein
MSRISSSSPKKKASPSRSSSKKKSKEEPNIHILFIRENEKKTFIVLKK